MHELPQEEVLESVILAPHAVKSLIEPAEVAGVVAFLAGPEGRAFTGVPVTMDQREVPMPSRGNLATILSRFELPSA